MRVELLRAWPHRSERLELEVPAGACVADALRQAGWTSEAGGYAVFGVRAEPQTPLSDGDRIELLRPLLADPKDARRRRADTGRAKG